MTDYDLGRQHGYCGLVAKYPNNINYMSGFTAGEKRAEKEWRDNQPDEWIPNGPHDMHPDAHYGDSSC